MTAPAGPPGSATARLADLTLRAGNRATRPLVELRPRHPAQFAVVAYLVAIGVIALLLLLPVSTTAGESPGLRVALFTATSAVSVTGLVVVDTATYWSGFGQAVILAGIQVGGFGIMTLGSLLVIAVSRRLGLRGRLLAQAETRSFGLGDVRRVLRGVAVMTAVVEGVTLATLTARFAVAYDEPLGEALWDGTFHAVSAFNNAGFALRSDGMVAYVSDPFVSLAVAGAVIAGGLGLPVIADLRNSLRFRRWSLHTKLVVLSSGGLLVSGWAAITAFEWSNPRTLGDLDIPGKLLAGFFAAVQTRTAGFNTVDVGQMEETTWLVSDALMFVGGAPASTAGGIKVTTFAVLLVAIVAEVRGERHSNAFGRRIPVTTLRLAVSVALLAIAGVAVGTLTLLAVSDLDLDRVLFETISALSTVGLSTGVTATLPATAHFVLVVLMLAGRVGTVTFASAIALRQRASRFDYPEERPIVG